MMNEQANDYEVPAKDDKQSNFNWALFWGCCVISLSIFLSIIFAGLMIAGQMPQSLHGHFAGTLVDGGNHPPGEFMSEWSAARFIEMTHEEFTGIIESGELSGTYTVFQVEREVWLPWDDYMLWDADLATVPVEYEIVTVDHRVFSRERLVEWLQQRIDNQ